MVWALHAEWSLSHLLSSAIVKTATDNSYGHGFLLKNPSQKQAADWLGL